MLQLEQNNYNRIIFERVLEEWMRQWWGGNVSRARSIGGHSFEKKRKGRTLYTSCLNCDSDSFVSICVFICQVVFSEATKPFSVFSIFSVFPHSLTTTTTSSPLNPHCLLQTNRDTFTLFSFHSHWFVCLSVIRLNWNWVTMQLEEKGDTGQTIGLEIQPKKYNKD